VNTHIKEAVNTMKYDEVKIELEFESEIMDFKECPTCKKVLSGKHIDTCKHCKKKYWFEIKI